MASVVFPMHPETLAWVKRVAQEQLADPKILDILTAWESGVKKPTLSQVQRISQKVHIPFGYFFLKKKPVEHFSVMEFRTLDSVEHWKESLELKDTVAQMTAIQDWMREYKRAEGYLPLEFVGKCKGMENCDDVLQMVRATLELKEDWFEEIRNEEQAFRFFRQKCEYHGIIVMQNGVVGNNTHRPLSLEEFRAFALTDDFAPLIFINARDHICGRIFSLLHEIVHIFLGKDNIFNLTENTTHFDKKIEQMCNRVAAEILTPQKKFIETWKVYEPEGNLMLCIKQVAKKFHCSLTVISRRALELHYISHEQYTDFVRIFSEHCKNGKTGAGGDYYNTLASRMDPRFIQLLENSIGSGGTTYTEAFRLTGTNRKTFDRLVKDMEKRRITE